MAGNVSVVINEAHSMRGAFPDVPTFPSIDTDALYENDTKPFHLVLPIAEEGRISRNGLLYDAYLVNRIEEELSTGDVEGLQGHLEGDDLNATFKLPVVWWIGTQRQEKTLWAKAYIPPGEFREYVRTKKAKNGKIGTSIAGMGERVAITGDTHRVTNFELRSVDVLESKQAALQLGREIGFAITAERRNGETPMSEPVQEIETLREQFKRSSDRVNALEAELQEMRQYAKIVLEMHSQIGENQDVLEVFSNYHTLVTELTEKLGVPSSDFVLRIEEYHSTIEQLQQQSFNRALEESIASETAWNVNTEAGKKQIAALRSVVWQQVLQTEGVTVENVAQIVKQAMSNENVVALAEAVREKLSGGSAVIPAAQKSANNVNDWRTPEGQKLLKRAFNAN